MPPAKPTAASSWTLALRQPALVLPFTSEGVACEGTAVESRTIKVRDKAFLFLGNGVARLMLQASLPQARELEASAPDACTVGSGGWVKLTAPPPSGMIGGWIAESYALAAGAVKLAKPSAAAQPSTAARPARPGKKAVAASRKPAR